MKTNIDAIMGKHGVVYQRITRIEAGFVKVENEEWRASSTEDIEEGEEIEVVGVKGVTLQVRRPRKEEKGIIGKLGKLFGKGQK